jgi:hypothetical protein
VASSTLTRLEQHSPVEPGGLGGPPCPLAQPLRHALLAQLRIGWGTAGSKRTRTSIATQLPKAARGSDYSGDGGRGAAQRHRGRNARAGAKAGTRCPGGRQGTGSVCSEASPSRREHGVLASNLAVRLLFSVVFGP